MKARVRPSASCTRRKIISPGSSSKPLSSGISRAGWPLGEIEHGRHLPLLCTVAHQAGIAAAAEGQRKGIEKDGFAGAGFTGQHCKAAGKLDIEPLDQDDVTDRQTGQHGRTVPSRGPIFLKALLDIGPLVLARLETAGLYKIVGVFVPACCQESCGQARRRRSVPRRPRRSPYRPRSGASSASST